MTDNTTLTPGQELESARLALRDLQLKIGAGDATVSPAELEAAESAVRYAETRVEFAAAAEVAAHEERQRAHLDQLLSDLPEVTDDRNVQHALHDLRDALSTYLTKVVEYNARRSKIWNEISIATVNGYAPEGTAVNGDRITFNGTTTRRHDAKRKIEMLIPEVWAETMRGQNAPFTGDPR